MCVPMPPEIVDYFNRQGVTLKVFSGDNPYTVQAAGEDCRRYFCGRD